MAKNGSTKQMARRPDWFPASNGKNGNREGTDTVFSPPANVEAEEAVIGSLFIDPEAYYEIAGFLKPEHFFRSVHGSVYRAIGNLLSERQGVDAITVSEVLTGRGIDVNPADLFGYLNVVPTSVNVESYARIVYGTAVRRRLMRAASEIANLAIDENQAIDRILGGSEQALFNVTDGASTSEMISARDAFRDLLDRTEALAESGVPPGIPTGFTDIDRLTGGLRKGEMFVLAGRPSMGKTALALAIADHVSVNERKRGAIFSLEMPVRQLTQRWTSSRSKIDLRQIRDGRIHENEWGTFLETVGRLGDAPIWATYAPAIRPSEIAAQCRRLQARGGLDYVIVDYLQLMESDRGRDNRVQEITDISRGLKKAAGDLDVPFVVLSQLSRKVEDRKDKRPQLADLRDSGAIEQDADIVAFIYRDEFYNPETTSRPNVAEILFRKNRNGPTGIVDLYFHARLATFRNLQRQEIQL